MIAGTGAGGRRTTGGGVLRIPAARPAGTTETTAAAADATENVLPGGRAQRQRVPSAGSSPATR